MTTTTTPPAEYIEFTYTAFIDGEMVRRRVRMTLEQFQTAIYPYTEYIVTTPPPPEDKLLPERWQLGQSPNGGSE